MTITRRKKATVALSTRTRFHRKRFRRQFLFFKLWWPKSSIFLSPWRRVFFDSYREQQLKKFFSPKKEFPAVPIFYQTHFSLKKEKWLLDYYVQPFQPFDSLTKKQCADYLAGLFEGDGSLSNADIFINFNRNEKIVVENWIPYFSAVLLKMILQWKGI